MHPIEFHLWILRTIIKLSHMAKKNKVVTSWIRGGWELTAMGYKGHF